MKQQLDEIPINQIRVKKNYRRTFNDKSIAELARSVKSNGVIQPIVVRPDGEMGYWLIAGDRRLRAATQAGLVTIPAVVRSDTDETKILELQLVENIQKESVPFMEEAYGLKELRDKGAYDVKEIAAMIGKSDAYVYCMVRLTAMSSDARMIAEKGWISKAVAWEISKLKNEEDQTTAANALARTQVGKLVTSSGAKHYIRDNFEGDSAGAMRKRRVSKFGPANSDDYSANWKYHLVRFTAEQFEAFKEIVHGRTETQILAEAVDTVMRDTGTRVNLKEAA
jgi:ParB family chromosome partitioning protein